MRLPCKPLTMDSMFVSQPPNAYVEILTANVTVFGGGDFGRGLGHEGRLLAHSAM